MSRVRDIEKLISDLERLGKDATQGKWWIDSHGNAMVAFPDDKSMETVFVTDPNMGPAVRHESTGNLSQWNNDVDASYIATACPENVLKVISHLRSGANAWRAISDFIETKLHADAATLREKVSRQLFNDGCHSGPTHAIEFIKALIDENIGLKEELESK